jgi:imidazolonepropionase-like amidohydrolase
MNRSMALVKAAYRKGVPIVAGSDQGIPGFTLHREIELYVNAGLSPLEAIRTASSIHARMMKPDSNYGIRQGIVPDFILVEGNPFDNISDLRKVKMIFKGDAITNQRP